MREHFPELKLCLEIHLFNEKLFLFQLLEENCVLKNELVAERKKNGTSALVWCLPRQNISHRDSKRSSFHKFLQRFTRSRLQLWQSAKNHRQWHTQTSTVYQTFVPAHFLFSRCKRHRQLFFLLFVKEFVVELWTLDTQNHSPVQDSVSKLQREIHSGETVVIYRSNSTGIVELLCGCPWISNKSLFLKTLKKCSVVGFQVL